MAKVKQILTTKDLMEMFSVSRRTIYNWRDIGLHCFHLSGDGLRDPVRYNLVDMRKFAKENDKVIVNQIFTN